MDCSSYLIYSKLIQRRHKYLMTMTMILWIRTNSNKLVRSNLTWLIRFMCPTYNTGESGAYIRDNSWNSSNLFNKFQLNTCDWAWLSSEQQEFAHKLKLSLSCCKICQLKRSTEMFKGRCNNALQSRIVNMVSKTMFVRLACEAHLSLIVWQSILVSLWSFQSPYFWFSPRWSLGQIFLWLRQSVS